MKTTAACLVVFAFLGFGSSLELKNGAYEDLVIKISEAVPVQDCRIVLDNLKTTLTSASQYLFSALDSRAFFRSATVMLPASWPDSCASSPVVSGAGETSDLTVLPRGPARGRIHTQQSLGCGQPGDQIYLSYESLMQRDGTLARSFVKNFAMYRYGVFEEQGYYNDPIYPMCFYDDQTKQPKATGCSDLPIDNGICLDPNLPYNTTKMADSKSRSSIMFAAEAPSVSMFCDDGNHDRYAPTKHNSICERRSVYNVITTHEDFLHKSNQDFATNTSQIIETTPRITYKKQNLTRYVFVLESTKDMIQRESWSYLRLAMRYWALNVLPANSEVGLVLAEDVSRKAFGIVPIRGSNVYDTSNRDKFYSAIPYTSDSLQPGCLHCSIKDAADMLSTRTKLNGAANNVIVVIAAGMNPSPQMDKVLNEIKKSKIKIATITYPAVVRSETLNSLAEKTGGASYTVFEQKLNVETTLLSTYFELHNILYDLVAKYYSGSEADLPVEIHRREITDDGRSSITGSFMLDPNMGQPAKFAFFTYNSVTPLIKSLKLISPSHQIFSNRNDKFIDFKMILLTANISEVGTWTYTVEPYQGNPQPHFLQVSATPVSPTAPVLKTKFWTHRQGPNLVLLAEIKKGEIPVLGAKVEVTATKPGINGSVEYKNKFELLDTGAGDPDITKGDGVYTRYFSGAESGAGLYTFEVVVSDNGNTAYTWTETARFDDTKPCCGSTIQASGVTPISPFQRTLPKITLQITPEQIASATQTTPGKIGDLKVQVVPIDMKARLSWTSPDMGGLPVSRYDIKYAESIPDITDNFETKAQTWESGNPFPLAPGSETTFTIDMSQNHDLLDKPLYFAIKAYPKHSSDVSGPISNWIRVLVPSPPPPPTVPPTYSSNEQSYWPGSNNNVGVDPVSPSIAKSVNVGLELILPIAIGILLLVILLVLYCYFCVVKRRDHGQPKKSNSKNDKMSTTITIVPSSPQNVSHQSYASDIPDPHQIGVPTYEYDEDTKKRYSIVNQQEQQLIEELKQQQMAAHLGVPPAYSNGLSVISNGTLRNGHTLSPYNSWSASQLLHEHERRHSPMDQEEMNHQEMLLNGMEHMVGHPHMPPPVPPLPQALPYNGSQNGYPPNYNIYGVHQNHPIYQSMQRSENFNPSLQGSMSSVNSGDKKRRNVTMV